MNKLVINIFGGPAAGKSTVACELYAKLKKLHIETEYISEVAKELVLEQNTSGIENQIYLFGCQLHKQVCAYKHTTVVIADSPLLLCAVYRQEDSEYLAQMALEQHNRFHNLNILLKRGDGYSHSMSGRIHSLVESVNIDKQIKQMLDRLDVDYINYDSFTTSIDDIVSLVLAHLENANATGSN